MWKRALFLAFLFTSFPAAATFWIGETCNPCTPAIVGTAGAFTVLPIGGGGQLTGEGDIQCNQGFLQCNATGTVTKDAPTDTYGVWVWTAATGWYQTVTAKSMPQGSSVVPFSGS